MSSQLQMMQSSSNKFFGSPTPSSPFGREFVLIERRNAWGEERVYFHDDSGRVRRLTAAWTSAVAPDPFASVSAGRSHFRVDDLLHLVALIVRQSAAQGSAGASSRQRKVSRE
jgi:hypothetical protein